MGGSSRRRGSGAGGRGRRARRATTKPEPEYAPQMEEADVQSTPDRQVWRGQQPWSDVGGNFGNCYVPHFVVSEPQFFDPQPVGVDYMTSVMGTTSLSSPLVSTDVGGAGPSMFRTPRRMSVESEDDSDDEDSGQVRGGVADDDDDDGESGAEARVRSPPRRYDDTDSLH
ncbi:hypothetical protein GQ457_01G021530 [Hibiscus cannabinus]